jgi:biopolymer transport protein ExbD
MIDVTFQLLLFFLLATTFRQAEGQIPAAMPQRSFGGLAQQDVVKPLVLSLRRAADDGVLYELSGTSTAWKNPQELYAGLVALRESFGSDQVPVTIQPNWDVPWKSVVEAFNQALRAKFRNVGIRSTAR